MTGEEGVSGCVASVSAMCLVCGTNQADLTHHLALHTKEEIIRAVTIRRPAPEAPRPPPDPAPRPRGRPRKITLQPPPPPLATVAPLSLRPSPSQPQLVLAGSQAQQPPVTAAMAPTPQVAPPPPPPPQSTASQPVRLSSIGPLIPPPRSGLPLASGSVQPSAPAPAPAPTGNYLLIGNNMFPTGSVISNNLQLGSSGVSYIIPSSGGLVLAAAGPPTSQTLLVQPPTTAPPQSLQVKPSDPPGPMATLAGGVYGGVACRPPRPVQADGPACMSAAPVQSEAPAPAPDTLRGRGQGQPDSHRTTINIGKNISISLPRELVDQKEKLKEIINQELVRALLMNEAKKGRGPAAGQPCTSTGGRGTVFFPAKTEEEQIEEVPEPLFCQDEDGTIALDEDVQYCGDTMEDDPLASDPLSGTPTGVVSPGASSSDGHVAVDKSLSGNFITSDTLSSYRSDTPMEVVFSEQTHFGPSLGVAGPSLIIGHGDDGGGGGRHQAGDGTCQGRPDRRSDAALASGGMAGLQAELGPATLAPGGPAASSSSSSSSQALKRSQAGEGEEHAMSFLSEERTLTSLLGAAGLPEMVYVGEEEVLGAVEEVFSGTPSVSTTTTAAAASTMSSTSVSEAAAHKLLQRRLSHTYGHGLGDHQPPPPPPGPAAPYRDTTQDKERPEVKCKYEVSGVSSAAGQAGPSLAQVVVAAAAYEPPHRDNTNTQDRKHEVKYEVGGGPSSGQLGLAASGLGGGYGPPPGSLALAGAEALSGGKGDKDEIEEEEEELVDDPSLVVDTLTAGSIFPDDHMFERDMASQHGEEVMSLKASETLADSDSERATPHEELSDLMFYDRNCMFAGEPGPANLSPRSYPTMDSSSYHSLTPALISPMDASVQMERVEGGSLASLGEGSSGGGVVELPSDTTLHITSEQCCAVLPGEGMVLSQLLPAPYTEATAAPSTSAATVTPTTSKVAFPGLMEDSKLDTKITLLESSSSSSSLGSSSSSSAGSGYINKGGVIRQPSPVPSTSGLQASAGHKSVKEDEDYELEYESDCYGDSDSDSGVAHRSPLDLDHWKCGVCNKMFKSLKEKLLHAGQHSPCAEAMEKSGAIRCAGGAKAVPGEVNPRAVEEAAAVVVRQCKEEVNALQEETRSMLESFAASGEYKCPECGQGFPTAELLFEHRKTVFKSRVTCQVCHMVFKKRHSKIKHMKTHTVDDLKCLICNRTYPNRYSWSQHQLFHMGLVLFECKECGRRFQRKSELEVHMRTHTGERPYSCASCQSAFTTRQALKRHLVTHMDGQEVDCDVCHKTYKNIVCLNKHRLKAHSKNKGKAKVRRDYMCSTCNEVFPSSKKLAWHRETHERWPKKCQHCGECFVHQSSLTKHIRHKHDPHHQTPDGKTENNATCPVCRKVFKKSSLVLHLRTHTGVKPFQCNICNRSFAVKCNLEAHKWVHMGVRDRPHKCRLCERSFHRQKDLDAHIRSHKNIRPFTCNECGKSFIHKNNLQLHVREHSGEKQHKCMFCGKAFFRKYNLDNHVRIHTGETPYECTICRKDFTQKSNYNVHMKAFHIERHAVHEEL